MVRPGWIQTLTQRCQKSPSPWFSSASPQASFSSSVPRVSWAASVMLLVLWFKEWGPFSSCFLFFKCPRIVIDPGWVLMPRDQSESPRVEYGSLASVGPCVFGPGKGILGLLVLWVERQFCRGSWNILQVLPKDDSDVVKLWIYQNLWRKAFVNKNTACVLLVAWVGDSFLLFIPLFMPTYCVYLWMFIFLPG